MDSFRTFVRRHVSERGLFALLGASLVSLLFIGEAMILNTETLMVNLDLRIVEQDRQLGATIASVRKAHNPPPSLEVPDRSLALGETSREVLLLQNFLKWRGFWNEDEEITGRFGNATLESLKKYQASVGLAPEGIAGPLTREMWKRDVEKVSIR